MNNEELRAHAREKRVKLWEIAEKLGRSEMYVTRALRHELPEAERARWMAIIDEIAENKGGAAGG